MGGNYGFGSLRSTVESQQEEEPKSDAHIRFAIENSLKDKGRSNGRRASSKPVKTRAMSRLSGKPKSSRTGSKKSLSSSSSGGSSSRKSARASVRSSIKSPPRSNGSDKSRKSRESDIAASDNAKSGDDSEDSENLCVICEDGKKTHMCYPCGHRCFCKSCVKECRKDLKECPLCRK